MTKIIREKNVRCVEERFCATCGDLIEVGQEAIVCLVETDGVKSHEYTCLLCNADEPTKKVIYQFDRIEYDQLERIAAEFNALCEAIDELRNNTDSIDSREEFLAYCKVTHVMNEAHMRLNRALIADLNKEIAGDK